jgi:hypothetical protein
MMNVRDMVEKALRDYQFDGLYNDECGCSIDDLMPCGDHCAHCEAGCNQPVDPASGFDFVIGPKQELGDSDLSANEQLQACINNAICLAADYDGQAQPDQGNYNGPGLCKLIDEIVTCLRSGKPIPVEAAADESDKGDG